MNELDKVRRVAVWAPAIVAGAVTGLFWWADAQFKSIQREMTELRNVTIMETQRVDMLQAMVSNISRQMSPMKTTWYGGKWHGRTTSSGAKFNKNGMTAAHRTLPFGTVLILEHEGRLAAVMITDRGPMEWTGKDLDITERAAEVLGMKSKGTATLNVRRLL